ncbi:Winged helix-turn-helix transcriptional regulator [Sulfidibacter corallicola]|uniref:Winged helix-turn-helix transcriptional regulator n=1 Tax=Sulfidibacter corallicola TaxID=2818388 RepID=A0A8A4TPR7_SULCO|nr:metalloregulator ArsR/SmtB family transcription factor [Sulfidibacter corallicola]QTD51550.1 winged helix-turn-helix transcriptional regulator [Sulfidibacter corallicola]
MSTDPLSLTLSALAHPARRSMLATLTTGELTVSELAAPFDMTGPAVTKHLKVLERAGLIERLRDAQRRPCRLRAKPLKDVFLLIRPYQKFWDESFDRLEEYLAEQADGSQPTEQNG